MSLGKVNSIDANLFLLARNKFSIGINFGTFVILYQIFTKFVHVVSNYVVHSILKQDVILCNRYCLYFKYISHFQGMILIYFCTNVILNSDPVLRE